MTIGPEDDVTTGPLHFDDTGRFLYLRDSRGRDTAALVALDTETGAMETLASDAKADAFQTISHPATHRPQAVAFEYQRLTWTVLDESVATDFERLADGDRGEFRTISRSLDDRTWIVAYDRADGPQAYYQYDRKSGSLEYLFSNRPELEKTVLAPMHSAVVRSRDQLDIVAYYSLPVGSTRDGADRPTEPLPAVLWVHGGPWSRDSWGYDPVHQLMTNRGYATISVNYRGSMGFGKAFVNAANGEWAGRMHDDLIDVVEWAVEQGIADRDRIAIMGGSYGGYATLVGLTFTPDVFACGVDLVGPSNLNTLLDSVPPYWRPMLGMLRTRVGDNSTPEGRRFLAERSPLSRADRIVRPLLIGQGANDPRVKQAESDQIVAAMTERGIPVTYLLYPDEGHGFARPENNLSFMAVAEAFLARCLGGRHEPVGDDFEGSSIQVKAGAEEGRGSETRPVSVANLTRRVIEPLADVEIAPAIAALPKADIHLHSEAGPRLEQVIAQRCGGAGDRLALARSRVDAYPAAGHAAAGDVGTRPAASPAPRSTSWTGPRTTSRRGSPASWPRPPWTVPSWSRCCSEDRPSCARISWISSARPWQRHAAGFRASTRCLWSPPRPPKSGPQPCCRAASRAPGAALRG